MVNVEVGVIHLTRTGVRNVNIASATNAPGTIRVVSVRTGIMIVTIAATGPITNAIATTSFANETSNTIATNISCTSVTTTRATTSYWTCFC